VLRTAKQKVRRAGGAAERSSLDVTPLPDATASDDDEEDEPQDKQEHGADATLQPLTAALRSCHVPLPATPGSAGRGPRSGLQVANPVNAKTQWASVQQPGQARKELAGGGRACGPLQPGSVWKPLKAPRARCSICTYQACCAVTPCLFARVYARHGGVVLLTGSALRESCGRRRTSFAASCTQRARRRRCGRWQSTGAACWSALHAAHTSTTSRPVSRCVTPVSPRSSLASASVRPRDGFERRMTHESRSCG
jgi:hypothetical protein